MASNNLWMCPISPNKYREQVSMFFREDSFILQKLMQSSVWLKKMNEALGRSEIPWKLQILSRLSCSQYTFKNY